MAGIVLAIVGVVVLVVAVIALSERKTTDDGGSSAAAQSGTRAGSTSSASSTSRSSMSPSSSPTVSRRSSGASHTSSTPGSSTPTRLTGPAAQAARSSADAAARAEVPLVVLNSSTISGLAQSAASRFEGGGWTVTSYGNLTDENIISTCAYYDPSITGAKAAAKALKRQYSTIERVRPKFTGLDAGPVVVVLTPDYSPG